MGCYFSFFQEVITVLSEYLSDFGIRICFFYKKTQNIKTYPSHFYPYKQAASDVYLSFMFQEDFINSAAI